MHAQEPAPRRRATAAEAAPPKSVTITDGRGAEVEDRHRRQARASTPPTAAPPAVDDADAERRRRHDAGRRGDPPAAARRAGKHARVTIDGLGTDREFDSFDDFVAQRAGARGDGGRDRRGRLPRAGAGDRAHPLVPDAQGAHAERDDAEARRKGRRPVRRRAGRARRRQAAAGGGRAATTSRRSRSAAAPRGRTCARAC